MLKQTLKAAIQASEVKTAYAMKHNRRFIVSAKKAPQAYVGYVQRVSEYNENEWVNICTAMYRKYSRLLSSLNEYGKPWRFGLVWLPVTNTEEWKDVIEHL